MGALLWSLSSSSKSLSSWRALSSVSSAKQMGTQILLDLVATLRLMEPSGQLDLLLVCHFDWYIPCGIHHSPGSFLTE